ncbi:MULTISPECIES: hypothetical protein [Acidovorax]|jgi:hypothetical protein|uniref:Uncharacterized protein n=1 Tax=Acidovorax carolinensis TaxID=553814 RepID=A0A240TR25_9BURK|nr:MULTISPECIES: hypothetical protein [Acidovorax]ART47578.1 hypothetical protein CBP33_05075 [Acidovorax carolinensis]ART55738.1 hypothetical protein CBP35_13420 [Acidovorax carolinensis]ART58394.1 hypothetical protein CBP36_05510 [Acidovorax carolinensis]MBP3979915.1 hypothetical protein [Acidovorax sp. JG5]
MAEFVNACQTCGAEESLDSVLHRMIDDDTVRRLIADVVTMSLPLGGLVVRYLRLHKPAKQRLRMEKVAALLAELVPDMQRSAIERSGRNWMVSAEDWKGAFAAVFAAVDKGSLEVPLKNGNAYLYSVLLRKSDRTEAEQEAQREQDRRVVPQRDTVQVRGQTLPIGEALQVAYAGKEPALAEIDARSQKAAPMPSDVRAKVAELLGKRGRP